MLSKIFVSKEEEQDQHDLDIEFVPQDNPDPSLISNQKPKWAKKLIETAENDVGDPYDRRKMRS